MNINVYFGNKIKEERLKLNLSQEKLALEADVDRTYVNDFQLRLYEDIYSLIDNIGIKNNKITLKPKKSYSAEIVTKDYKTPIEFELT